MEGHLGFKRKNKCYGLLIGDLGEHRQIRYDRHKYDPE